MSDTDPGAAPNLTEAGDDAEAEAPAIRREAGGRFARGHSANPAGRPPGSIDAATRIIAELLNQDAEQIGRTLIEGAKWGKPVSLKLVVDPIIAQLKKHRPAFGLPPVREPDDVPVAIAAIAEAVAAGLFTAEEAASWAQMLESHARALGIAERIRADRQKEDVAAIGLRSDLRHVVQFAFHVLDCRHIAEPVDTDMARLCKPIETLGDHALTELLMIPDTPELLRGDRAYVAQHPFGADRVRHPLVEAMRPFGEEFLEYFDSDADDIDRRLDALYDTKVGAPEKP